MDIMVPPAEAQRLEADLAGLSFKVLIPDVQKLIDLEKIPAGGNKLAAGRNQQSCALPQQNLSQTFTAGFAIENSFKKLQVLSFK